MMVKLIFRFLILILSFFMCYIPVWAAKPYKIYVVNRYGAWDIVCDRYAVQKGDHIWEILRRKGRIAEENFPQFVEILKEMNPHIKDVDKIYPGQNIVIPLKHIAPQERDVPEKSGPRYVTIPMIPDVLFDYYRVESGDYLSQIVTRRLDVAWHEIPSDYFKTLKRLNPQIQDLDLIYPGQLVRIPEFITARPSGETMASQQAPGLTGRPKVRVDTEAPHEDRLSESLGGPVKTARPSADEKLEGTPSADLEVAENVQSHGSPNRVGGMISQDESDFKVLKTSKRQMVPTVPPPAVRAPHKPQWLGLVSRVAEEIGGRLLTSGYCYFPGRDGEDVPLDLTVFPVVELRDGRHVLFEAGIRLPRDVERTIRKSWKNVIVIEKSPEAAGKVVLDRFFQSLFADRIRQSLRVPVLDDGIQVILGGDWVFPLYRTAERAPVYCAVTLIQNVKEETSSSVITYLAKKGVRVIDVTDKGEISRGSDYEKVSEGVSILTTSNSGQEAFVSALTEAMGYYYEPRVAISFEYAGFQVETAANILYGKSGTDVIVDFGTFYGDAATSIERGGLKVVSIGLDDKFMGIAKALFDALECSHTESPELFAANRGLERTTSLVLPGVLVLPAGGKTGVLTDTSLPAEIIRFLEEKEISVWQIGSQMQRGRTISD